MSYCMSYCMYIGYAFLAYLVMHDCMLFACLVACIIACLVACIKDIRSLHILSCMFAYCLHVVLHVFSHVQRNIRFWRIL